MAGHWCTDGVLGQLAKPHFGVVTIGNVARWEGISHHRAKQCLAILCRRGFAERIGRGQYQVTVAGREAWKTAKRIRSGPTGPHTGPRRSRGGTFQARFWSAFRRVRTGTLPELIALADPNSDHDHTANARKYLRALVRAEYVRELPRRERGTAPTSNGFKRWLLVKDTGPTAPVWNPDTQRLRDRNTGAVIHLGASTEGAK